MDGGTIALLGAVVAFIVTLLLQRVLNPVASRLDLMDYPNGRKDHAQPTPIIGGVAMLIGVSNDTQFHALRRHPDLRTSGSMG